MLFVACQASDVCAQVLRQSSFCNGPGPTVADLVCFPPLAHEKRARPATQTRVRRFGIDTNLRARSSRPALTDTRALMI